MRRDDKQLGKPEFVYRDTQANISLITGSANYGMVGCATDTGLLGHCVGNSWVWEREVLNANRTYYVSTGGNDSNNGLTSGGAFLTIQKAIDTAALLDLSLYNVTIQIADGTYSSGTISLKSFLGSGTITIQGNAVTPTNVKVVSSSTCFSGSVPASYVIKDLQITAAENLYGIQCMQGSIITISGVDFAAITNGIHILASIGGVITSLSNYTISGAAAYHYYAQQGAIQVFYSTVTISGSPAFTVFAYSTMGGLISTGGEVYSGACTGIRYTADSNAIIKNYSGGANYFPGNSAGTTATGGQYV